MKTQRDLSIIIVNFNGARLLEDCLASIAETSASIAHDVWVVDNGSTDNSVRMVRARFPDVHIIESAENLGFAGGNNLALASAAGRYRLLLNNDTVVRPHALQAMVQAMDAHPELAGIGPRLLNPNGSTQLSCMHYPSLVRGPRNWIKAKLGQSGKYQPEAEGDIARVDAVVGACLMIRDTALYQVGLLDPGYFMYAEEMDWCYSAAKAGWQIGYLPSAEVVHFGGQTAGREADRFYVERRYSRVRFYMKHHGRLAARTDDLFIRANIVLRWLTHPGERKRYAALLGAYNRRVAMLFAAAGKRMQYDPQKVAG